MKMLHSWYIGMRTEATDYRRLTTVMQTRVIVQHVRDTVMYMYIHAKGDDIPPITL